MDTGRFSPWLGETLADSPRRRATCSTNNGTPPDTYEFELLLRHVGDSGGTRGLFSGISLAAGCDARRPQPELPVEDIDELRRLGNAAPSS